MHALSRPGVALLVLFVAVSGCVSAGATFERRPSAAVASAQDVAAGERLYPFQAADGRWGFMDVRGDEVVAARFEGAAPFSEGRAAVRDGGRVGFVDPAGRLVVEARYTSADPFSEGRARVSVGLGDEALYGFVAADGTEVVSTTLPHASGYADGRAIVRLRKDEPRGVERLLLRLGAGPRQDSFVLLDRDGAVVANLPYADVLPFSGGLAPFQASRNRWGYLGPDGRVAIEPRFDGPAFLFSEGLARVGQGGRIGFVDSTGALVIAPTFASAGPFSEGLAAVAVDGRWGYIDRTGRLVVAPRFEQAGPFSEGLAVVQVDGRWGYIDPAGAVAIAPQYRSARAFRGGLALVDDDGRVFSITPDGRRVGPAGSR